MGNVHAAANAPQGQRAAATMLEWAGGASVVLGGDFNVSPLKLDGLSLAGGNGVDQVWVGGGLSAETARVLDRGQLSDHAPILVGVIENRS